jgi:hypothetical protein
MARTLVSRDTELTKASNCPTLTADPEGVCTAVAELGALGADELERVDEFLSAERAARRGLWLTFEQYRAWCLEGNCHG